MSLGLRTTVHLHYAPRTSFKKLGYHKGYRYRHVRRVNGSVRAGGGAQRGGEFFGYCGYGGYCRDCGRLNSDGPGWFPGGQKPRPTITAAELKREYDEVERVPEQEKMEVKEVFASFGLSAQLQNDIADEMAKNKDKWVDLMMRYELGLEKPEANRARQSALTIGFSYIVGGVIPLSPYFFVTDSQRALYYSCAITLVCLFVFGYFKSKVTGSHHYQGLLKY